MQTDRQHDMTTSNAFQHGSALTTMLPYEETPNWLRFYSKRGIYLTSMLSGLVKNC